MKINLLNIDEKELESHINISGYPKFRAKQIFNWIYKKNIFDFKLMSNLPKDLINYLDESFLTKNLNIIDMKYSIKDNSYKFLLQTNDGNLIESIAMVKENRTTICLSCMIGCPLACKFCATGTELKFKRNLDTSEILGQFIEVQNYLNKNNISTKINNIVFMGMGEPFLNIKNIEKSINIFTSKNGLELSKNRITISTAGIINGLSDFINKHDIKLAVSIHFPTDEQRSEYMPINQKIPLKELINELKKIKLNKRNHITIEYLMIDEINDSILHAQKLKTLIQNLKVKVNLIPYNPTKMFNAKPSKEYQINEFAKYLNSKSIFTTVRRSKGKEILGGCGQFVLNK